MSQTLQNLLILLAILVVGGLGWYMYSQQSQQTLMLNGASSIQADIQLYRQQQNTLQRLQLDTSLLSEANFRSLQSVTEPVPQFPLGRSNPFNPSF